MKLASKLDGQKQADNASKLGVGGSHLYTTVEPFMFLAVLVGVVLVIGKMFPSSFAVVILILALAGFAMFSVAKISVFKQGLWIEFGSSRMTRTNRILYRTGYVLMLFSVFFALLLATSTEWEHGLDAQYFLGIGVLLTLGGMLVYVIWRGLIRRDLN